MNSPVQLAEKLEEFEDVKRTLKQKSSNPYVKKQEFKPMEKTRRYEAPRKFGITTKTTKNTQTSMLPSLLKRTIQCHGFKERPTEICSLIVKEGLRTKEIFFGKKKITVLLQTVVVLCKFATREHKQKNNGSNKIIKEQNASHR
ncbi:hypothetical protein TNCT_445631 [Trichonephila clavata]|uniref:Uncharacterized protein n=1 Tax=Trichonephila clavata TaxID=2740835 RepID=A0A8X6LY36_TRICU|nr:hypothetical protein TNCT_445631 [Trichonephila clavata]